MNATQIIPLGGLGQFGANATIIKTRRSTILVDFGLMFPPDKRQPGVDFYINDPQKILDHWPKLEALFITHGHEDHIGGLFYLLKKKNIPVFATAYTGALIASADPMVKKLDLRVVEPLVPVTVGDISVEYIPVTHSIAKAACLFFQTPGGTILHSGDFKLDPMQGDGDSFGVDRLSELAQEGIDLLLMDSTNAGQAGFSGSEAELLDSYRQILQSSPGRVLISTFSSSLPRLINVSRIAKEFNRKVALVGRSFKRHFDAAVKTGYIVPDETFVSIEDAMILPSSEVLLFVTGSQGEVNAALTKIAHKTHQEIQLQSSDTVIFASRAIPGNERGIALLRSHLERSGCKVITPAHSKVHVSGHAYREELAFLANLTLPGTVMPIHGEFTMLNQNYNWLKTLGEDRRTILLRSNGDEIVLKQGVCSSGKKWEVELLPVDGNQLVPISNRSLKQRKDLMYSGLVLISGTRGFGEMRWDVETAGIAEETPGNMKNLVLNHLNKHSQNTARDNLKRELKKAIRPHFRGMPVIKIILEGKII